MCVRGCVLRQITKGKGQKCVSEAVHETDYHGEKRKMCVRGQA
jgi:hypothetical protein